MDNIAVARAIDELADLMDLNDETSFRIRAFRTAARAIESHDASIAELAHKGELTNVRGVGDGVARRIKELIETGKMADVEALRAKLPPGLMELMKIPGVGLKTAQQVWRERGVTTVDALEAAAKAEQLRDLPRFGPKREEKLVNAIAAWRKRASAPQRRLMAEALLLADALVEQMLAVKGVLQCSYAGSLRRRAETIGDLDILVAAEDADRVAIMDAFATAPSVVEVLGKGETKTSVVLDGGMQADLRIVARASWGAAMQYFTGSKDHNVAMRTIAVKKGLKVSEYGVFEESGKSIAGDDEAKVYEAIGLAWMPPELRENRGEVELAQQGTVPDLVQLEDVLGDLHMHTTETDGKATIEQMAEAARAAGRQYVAITDHSEALVFVRGMTPDRLKEQVRRVREADEKLDGSIRVLAGVEADILADGSLDLYGSLDDLDWVVGSVHSQLGMKRADMTKRVVKAIESGKIDCLGHPTGRQIGTREPSELDVEAVLAALERVGAAIELNCSPQRLDVSEHMARMARDAGVPVVMNSDAHSVRELGFLRYGIGIARRAWLAKEHLLNTRKLEELREWRAARRS